MATPPKGRAGYWAPGDWNAQCFECGHKRKASYLVKHWQGYWVCPEHWEPRHPQDFVKSVNDDQSVPFSQPQPADTFALFCTPQGTTGIAGYGVAGCAIAAFKSPFFDSQVQDFALSPQ